MNGFISVMGLFLCFSRLSLFVLLANAEIAADGERLGLLLDLGRTLLLVLDTLRARRIRACSFARHAASFHLAMGTGAVLHAVAFQLAVQAGVASQAAAFHFAVRAGGARRAHTFLLGVRTGVAHSTLALLPPVRAPLRTH